MHHSDQQGYITRAIEVSIRLIIVFVIVAWCFEILRPFITSILGGIILAVAAFPIFSFMTVRLKIKDKLAAALLTLFLILLLIVPFYLLLSSLAKEFQILAGEFRDNKLLIPVLPVGVQNAPIIGKPLTEGWGMATSNISLLAQKYGHQLQSAGSWFLGMIIGLGSGILHFLFSIIISGIILANAKDCARLSSKLFVRIAGKSGDEFSHTAERTIQNVTKGILGVAIIEAALAGVGLFIAGVPLAGIWTMLFLLLSIVQIGIIPLALPIVIYMFYTSDTLTAVLLTVWFVIVYLLEHLLKPALLGHKAPVPMAVIFIGVIGGFLAAGFVGMFLGAVVFSIGYKLFLAWLDNAEPTPAKTLDDVK